MILPLLRYSQRCNISNTIQKFKSHRFSFITRCYCQQSLNINTNVVKDVILYKYTNDRFYKVINIFAVCQFSFWTYLALFGFTSLRDVPVDSKEEKWWRKINLGEKKYKNTFIVISFLIGWGILCVTWMYSLRSVKYLILRKGGNEISVVTYTPTGRNKIMTVPLDSVSCVDSRVTAPSQLPLKVKGHYLHYILDMRGEFKNPTLFDQTAGLRRKWAV